jgi:hypothetical protein
VSRDEIAVELGISLKRVDKIGAAGQFFGQVEQDGRPHGMDALGEPADTRRVSRRAKRCRWRGAAFAAIDVEMPATGFFGLRGGLLGVGLG